MATTLIGAIVNIVLDPVFIFLLHMNIAGAALATVLAQLSSCVFVLLTLKQKKMPIPLTLAPIRRCLLYTSHGAHHPFSQAPLFSSDICADDLRCPPGEGIYRYPASCVQTPEVVPL